jgi:hypothetical protein
LLEQTGAQDIASSGEKAASTHRIDTQSELPGKTTSDYPVASASPNR